VRAHLEREIASAVRRSALVASASFINASGTAAYLDVSEAVMHD
jgi:hypothetical protein